MNHPVADDDAKGTRCPARTRSGGRPERPG